MATFTTRSTPKMDTGRTIGLIVLVVAALGIYLETKGALVPVLGQVVHGGYTDTNSPGAAITFTDLVIALAIIGLLISVLPGDAGAILALLIIAVALILDSNRNGSESILSLIESHL